MDLSILIITKNAQDTLSATLKSTEGLACQKIVVDEYSTDKTKQIARAHGCAVINHTSDNFGEQRALALSQVKTKWVLILDSDEVLTKESREEMRSAITKDNFDGYYLKFRNHLFGKKLLHGELHKKLVLFKTLNAHISSQEVHEVYEVAGRIGVLSCEIDHYSYRSVGQVIRKFFRYSVLQAKQYKKEKKKWGVRELFLHPLHMFYSRFIKDGGYKDGLSRIFLDYQFAHMEFLSYAFIPFVKEKKRVAIDYGSYCVGEVVQSGIDRLLQGIYSYSSNKYEYYWFSFSKKSKFRLPIHWYSQLWLPCMTLLRRCDVFFGVAGSIPLLFNFFPIKKILFLHDFGFFSSPEKYVLSAQKLQKQTERSIRIADAIVFFNDEIYKEFIDRYPQYSYKAKVIPAGADHLELVEERPVFIQPKAPMILYVGVVKPVKRIDKLISAVGDTYCVIAGPQEKAYKAQLSVGKSQNIHFIQNLNDGQLKWLYKHADVMVYTSEHEGFCYPVLEALTLGLPVVAFDLPIFQHYQKYFPHLILVKTDSEMKSEIEKKRQRIIVATKHPYTWKTFNSTLESLLQNVNPSIHKMKKIAFIVVLHKTPDREKNRLLKEINDLGFSSFTIYWVDNSTNGKGYAAGVNEGIRKGLVDGCNAFVALNPDISLLSIKKEIILKAVDTFDVWGFGMQQAKTIYYGGATDEWRLSGGLVQNKPKNTNVEVGYVSGSLIGFSQEVVQRIGLWDESYFMYYEDVDFCERAHRAGFSVGIDSEASYTHFEDSQMNAHKKEWIAKSRWRFFWKYATIKQMVRELVRLPITILEK